MVCADCRFAAHAVLSVPGVGRICVPCFKARNAELNIGLPSSVREPRPTMASPTQAVVNTVATVTYAAQLPPVNVEQPRTLALVG